MFKAHPFRSIPLEQSSQKISHFWRCARWYTTKKKKYLNKTCASKNLFSKLNGNDPLNKITLNRKDTFLMNKKEIWSR